MLISVLLAPTGSTSAPAMLYRRALMGDFQMTVSETTIAEVRERVANKPYLASRIPPDAVDQMVATIRRTAIILPVPAEPPPLVTRDPKDDYLLAPEMVSQVDHIVTGDRDLLEYTGVEPGFIVTAAEFLERYVVTTSDKSSE